MRQIGTHQRTGDQRVFLTGDDAAAAFRRCRVTERSMRRFGFVGMLTELDGRPINALTDDPESRRFYREMYGIEY